jgi:hypothetical protein
MTKHFSPEERAEIFRKSRELLMEPGQPSAPPPAPEPPPIEVETEAARWARESTEYEQRRRIAKTELRCREQLVEAERARAAPDWSAIDARINAAIDARIASIEAHLPGLDQLASAAGTFSDAVERRFHAMAALIDRLDRTFGDLRAVHEREIAALRDRLASSEALHTRETVLLAKQLSDAQRELDHRADLREHVRTRVEVAGLDEKVENVVSLVREDIASRRR